MNTLPLRLTILHLAQRFRTDGETFMKNSLRPSVYYIAKFLIILVHLSFVQPIQTQTRSRDSQE